MSSQDDCISGEIVKIGVAIVGVFVCCPYPTGSAVDSAAVKDSSISGCLIAVESFYHGIMVTP